ncbi:unnamed protein product [Closterium sp. NIES-65]|nr:unnamed protein product [Closterium sp. NIES-65]
MSLANLALHQSPASLTSSRCRFPLTVPNPASNLTFRSGPSRPLGIRASAEPEPSQTSDSSSTSAVKEPAAGKAAAGKPAAGKGFGKAPQQPAVVRRPAPSQPLLSTRPVGEEEKKAAEIETAVVASLGFVFLLIILEGLFLAAAGACNAGDLKVGRGDWKRVGGRGCAEGGDVRGELGGRLGRSTGPSGESFLRRLKEALSFDKLIFNPPRSSPVAHRLSQASDRRSWIRWPWILVYPALSPYHLITPSLSPPRPSPPRPSPPRPSPPRPSPPRPSPPRPSHPRPSPPRPSPPRFSPISSRLPIGGAGSHGNRPGVSRLLSIPSHRPKPLPTRFTPPCPCAGFLSEELDQLAMDLVYPAFSPTVAVFLLGATAYGAFKVIGIGGKKQ